MLKLYKSAYSGLSSEVWILALVMLVNRTGAMLMPFLSIIMTEGRGFSLAQAGYLMSAFGLGSILGSWLGGKLTDSLGFYRVQLWSLMLTGIMFLLLASASGFITMLLGIFTLSLVADIFRPANQAAIVLYSHPEHLTRSFGLQRLAFNLGYSIGPALAGLLMVRFGHNAIFYMSALGYLLSFFLLWRLLPAPSDALVPKIETEEKEKSPSLHTPPWQNVPYLKFLFFNFLAVTGFFQLISSIPAYWKKELLFSEFEIGLLMGLNGLLIVLIEMPLLYRIENRISKRISIAGGALLFLLSYAALLTGLSAVWAAVLYIVLISIGEMFYMPFTSSLIGMKAPQQRLGQYMGWYSISWGIGIVLAPTGGLYVADHWGFEALWYLSMLVCLFAALGIGYGTYARKSNGQVDHP